MCCSVQCHDGRRTNCYDVTDSTLGPGGDRKEESAGYAGVATSGGGGGGNGAAARTATAGGVAKRGSRPK